MNTKKERERQQAAATHDAPDSQRLLRNRKRRDSNITLIEWERPLLAHMLKNQEKDSRLHRRIGCDVHQLLLNYMENNTEVDKWGEPLVAWHLISRKIMVRTTQAEKNVCDVTAGRACRRTARFPNF